MKDGDSRETSALPVSIAIVTLNEEANLPRLLASVMDAHQIEPADSLETILAADHAARQHAAEIVAKFAVKSETTAVR